MTILVSKTEGAKNGTRENVHKRQISHFIPIVFDMHKFHFSIYFQSFISTHIKSLALNAELKISTCALQVGVDSTIKNQFLERTLSS